MKFTSILALVGAASATVYPTVVFHGFGDQCSNAGMASFTKELAA